MVATLSLAAATLLIPFVGGIAASATPPVPAAPFNQCPAIGDDTSCGFLIVLEPGGTSQILADPSQGPYDGDDDTLIGVINNSGGPVSSVSLSAAASGSDIFDFDGDGICTFAPFTGSDGCPYGDTGYEGPDTSFSNYSPDNDFETGTVNFSQTPAGLPDGATAYFSLEEALVSGQFNPVAPTTITSITTSNSSIRCSDPVTFSAGLTFTPSSSTPSGAVPTGTVEFDADGEDLGTVPLDSDQQASLTTSGLPPGLDTITAFYSGDANYGSSSASLTETVGRCATEVGVLMIHGPGSVFSGSGTTATQEGTAGATVSYAIKVKNTGDSTSQYLVRVSYAGSSCTCTAPTVVVDAGSKAVTPSATGSIGYFTAPVKPDATTPLTLKVTIPKGSAATSGLEESVAIYDTAEDLLDNVYAYTEVTATKGTSGIDEFLVSSGQKSVGANNTGLFTNGLVVPEKLAGTAKFTLKLENDSSTAGAITFKIAAASSCDASFPLDLKVGSADITAAAASSGGYVSKVLAHNASVTVAITIKYASIPSCSLSPVSGEYLATTSSGSQSQSLAMIVYPAAS